MSQFNDSGCFTATADAAVGLYERVKMDADGKVTQAGLADRCIGVAMTEAFASGDVINVALYSKAGTLKMIAVEALSAGAVVYTEASGKVQDTAASTAFPIGIALEAATADGDVIEVMPAVGNEANP
jgi:hypothetical protein